MSRRSGSEIDDEETSIYDSAGRPRKDTERGHEASQQNKRREPKVAPKRESAQEREFRERAEKEAFRKRAIEISTPTAIDAPVPIAPQRERSEPIRVISMKTPEAGADVRQIAARAHKVKLRAMSELNNGRLTPPRGHLAPPRDIKQARSRRFRDLVIWGCAVIVIGSAVMIAVWLIAR